jgi:hypothetical protein
MIDSNLICSTVARITIEMTYGIRAEGPENEVRLETVLPDHGAEDSRSLCSLRRRRLSFSVKQHSLESSLWTHSQFASSFLRRRCHVVS